MTREVERTPPLLSGGCSTVSIVRQMLSEFAEVAREWHLTLNGDLTPDVVPAHAPIKGWWRCPCDHDYLASVRNRTSLGRGCPYCANRRLGYGNDLASRFPAIAAEFHRTRNDSLTPDAILAGSSTRCWWRCPAGHDYETTVTSRTRSGTACPYCAGRKAGYGNDLASQYPDIAILLHPKMNGHLTAADIVPGSTRVCWWTCGIGHAYRSSVEHEVRRRRGCPVCNGRRVEPGSALTMTHPELAQELADDLNPGITGDMVNSRSRRRLRWRCPEGHVFVAGVDSRVKHPDIYRCCPDRQIPVGADLASKYPAVAAEWHPTHNDGRPNQVSAHSHVKAWWTCAACGHEWVTEVAARTNGRGCPRCGVTRNSAARRTPRPGRSLADRNPRLAAEWHPDRNDTRTPQTANAGSSDAAWWQCSACDHEWSASIAIRSRQQEPSGCPACAGQVATAANNLALLHPDLADQWRPQRNGDLKPSQTTPSSHRTVWWRCKRDHEWPAIISSRTRLSRNGCPYCSNQKVGYGNDLATRYPATAATWHPTRNAPLTPADVTAGSDKKIWWLCPNGHTWQTTIDSRTSRQSGCPECFLRPASRQEIRIYAELENLLRGIISPIVHGERIRLASRRLEAVDMRFGSAIVELDGAYWHRDKQDADTSKTARLSAAGFRVVRIRERPLNLVTADDISVPVGQDPCRTAVGVIQRLAELGIIDVAADNRIQPYIASPVNRATQTANIMIEQLLKDSKRSTTRPGTASRSLRQRPGPGPSAIPLF
jgi:hypothetical protein